jgi:hypothetical protein
LKTGLVDSRLKLVIFAVGQFPDWLDRSDGREPDCLADGRELERLRLELEPPLSELPRVELLGRLDLLLLTGLDGAAGVLVYERATVGLAIGLGELLLLFDAGALTGRETVVTVCLWGWGADGVRVTRWVEDLLLWLAVVVELVGICTGRVCPWYVGRLTDCELGRVCARTV